MQRSPRPKRRDHTQDGSTPWSLEYQPAIRSHPNGSHSVENWRPPSRDGAHGVQISQVRGASDNQPTCTYLFLYAGLSLYWLPAAVLGAVLMVRVNWVFLPFVAVGLLFLFRPNRPIALLSYADHRAVGVPSLSGRKEWRCEDIVELTYIHTPGMLRGTAKLWLVLNDGTSPYLPGSSGRILRGKALVSDSTAANERGLVIATSARFLRLVQGFTGRPLNTSEGEWWG
jgi:hypothetical protein